MLRPIGATILPTTTRPEIEIDEQWSYVGSKGEVTWHWVAVERGTKRVVGWAVGNRGPKATAQRARWIERTTRGAQASGSISNYLTITCCSTWSAHPGPCSSIAAGAG
jgi:hypothetical protein